MTKRYDVVARVGSYTDSSGQEKGRFENVGAVIMNQNGGYNLLLKKTFNPAGLAEPDKECILLSLFEPQQKDGHGQASPRQQQPQRGNVRESPMANNPRGQSHPPGYDEEVGF